MRLVLITALLLSGAGLLPAMRHAPPDPSAVVAAPAPDGWNRIVVPADAQGHFIVAAMVNGERVDFLLDTGASHVVLSPEDAVRVGLRSAQLRFTGTAQTANGVARLAPVTLRELRIGQLSRHGVPAVVNRAPMAISLLGMSFLEGLEGWEARNGQLHLYW